MDRLVDGLSVAIDPDEQRRLTRELIRLHTLELPVLPLNYSVNATLFREGVTGVKGDTQPCTNKTWNITEWDMRP